MPGFVFKRPGCRLFLTETGPIRHLAAFGLFLSITRRRETAPERLGPRVAAALAAPGTESRIRDVARRSRTVSMAHQDPADRFLAATTQVYVTDDGRLKGRGFAGMPNS